MPKLMLNTIDSSHDFIFEKAKIYTSKYNAWLKPDAIHVPSTAKIIIKAKDVFQTFVMSLPIVICAESGDIRVFTQTPYEIVTLKDVRDFTSEKEMKIMAEELKTISAKRIFGLSSEDVVRQKAISVKLELYKIVSRLKDKAEGGGF